MPITREEYEQSLKRESALIRQRLENTLRLKDTPESREFNEIEEKAKKLYEEKQREALRLSRQQMQMTIDMQRQVLMDNSVGDSWWKSRGY